MSAATATDPKIWTTEDLLAMPDDGIERWIIRGQLREKAPEIPGVTMTVRNRHHSRLVISIGTVIKNWIKSRPKPWGEVYGGEAGVRLMGSDANAVGIDVVYASADVVEVQSDDETTLLDGVPTLVVEILSPNDTQKQIHEKIDGYLAVGVAAVWIVDPHRQTVTVYGPAQRPVLFSLEQRLTEIAEMPGFTPNVSELFE